MVSEGWLSPADRAQAGLPETIEQQPNTQWQGTNGYLLKTVQDELTGKVGLSEEDIERGGLKIVTTFDPKAQAAAVQAVQDQLPSKLPEGFHVALSAIDPKTGGVTAMYGGSDYLSNQFNDVTQAVVQPGSTFKPFALVAGLEDGVSLKTTFNGANGQTVDGYRFRNYGDESFGRIDLVTATEHSVNTVYAQLNEEVTPAKTRDVAVAAGYPEDTKGLVGPQYIANVLGTASPHRSTSPRPTPPSPLRAHGPTGTPSHHRRLDGCADVHRVAHDVPGVPERRRRRRHVRHGSRSSTRAPAPTPSRLGGPAAGKTGTTNDNLAAWFAGTRRTWPPASPSSRPRPTASRTSRSTSAAVR